MVTIINDRSALLEHVLETMQEGVLLLDESLCVKYVNPMARALFSATNEDVLGQPFLPMLNQSIVQTLNHGERLLSVMHQGEVRRNIRRTTNHGQELSFNLVPAENNEGQRYLLITIQDISEIIVLQNELDMAFSLSLPSPQVLKQLHSIDEFVDVPGPGAEQITIQEVIRGGGYKHIVNSLKIYSALVSQGLSDLLGIDQGTMVRSITLHDLGKSQPSLSVGDIVKPTEVFEDGNLHAYRSANIAKYTLNESDDVYQIIMYHHRAADELPDSFPPHLLPMWRLFKIVDGLSAALTRGHATFKFHVSGSIVTIAEQNIRPKYNGTRRIDLYTGNESYVPHTT